jgi:hypothetical protein
MVYAYSLAMIQKQALAGTGSGSAASAVALTLCNLQPGGLMMWAGEVQQHNRGAQNSQSNMYGAMHMHHDMGEKG